MAMHLQFRPRSEASPPPPPTTVPETPEAAESAETLAHAAADPAGATPAVIAFARSFDASGMGPVLRLRLPAALIDLPADGSDGAHGQALAAHPAARLGPQPMVLAAAERALASPQRLILALKVLVWLLGLLCAHQLANRWLGPPEPAPSRAAPSPAAAAPLPTSPAGGPVR